LSIYLIAVRTESFGSVRSQMPWDMAPAFWRESMGHDGIMPFFLMGFLFFVVLNVFFILNRN